MDNNLTTVTIRRAQMKHAASATLLILATSDRAIAQVDNKRSKFGALDNRLLAIIENHDETNRHLSAARFAHYGC